MPVIVDNEVQKRLVRMVVGRESGESRKSVRKDSGKKWKSDGAVLISGRFTQKGAGMIFAFFQSNCVFVSNLLCRF